MMILGIAGSVVFFAILTLHIYWLLGGRAGLNLALPPDREGVVREPTTIEYIVVLLMFLIAALLPLVSLQVVETPIPGWLNKAMLAFGLTLLAVRGIGGLIWSLLKPTPRAIFHIWNIRLYSPICVFLMISYAASLWHVCWIE